MELAYRIIRTEPGTAGCRLALNSQKSSHREGRVMPALSKQTLKHRPRARTKPVAKSPSRSAEPFLRFYHSKALRAKTLAVLSSVEQAKDLQHRDELADIVVELTNSGMDYYFLRPLKIANAGFFVEQSAKVGMAATTRVLASVICSIISRMDKPQLLTVCSYIRGLME